jgi:two-component system, chemotaxis family, chemotaxis protein CheY
MKKFKFIIADDSPVDKFLHAKIVSECGHDVIGLADDGEALINQCTYQQPDMILCDTIMPKLDGISVCKKLKNIYPSIKYICTTSFADLSFPVQIKNNGIDALLLKGFTAHKLSMLIDHLKSNKFYIDILLHQYFEDCLSAIEQQLKALIKIPELTQLKELTELSKSHSLKHNGETLKINYRHVLLVSAIYHSFKRVEIAELLHLGTDAVDINIKRLRTKLCAENKNELVKLFTEWGLIQSLNKTH